MEISELSLSQIGLHLTTEPSVEALVSCGKGLREAFSKVGFVYIRDHGISPQLIEGAMDASKQYFLMPTEAKQAFPRDPAIQQGYVR